MAIKEVLRDELASSIQIKARFEAALEKLPRGSLVPRLLKGHIYYYLVSRENGKVRSAYVGKSVSTAKLDKYKTAKELRAKYRHSLSILKKQIRFLKGALRGKEEI